MKIITILVATSFLFMGCKNLPPYPQQLNKFHQVMVKGLPISDVTLQATHNADVLIGTLARSADPFVCLEFDVVHVNPYEFDFVGVVPFAICHEVAGYHPDENVLLWNWIDDVFRKIQNKPSNGHQQSGGHP
jgi:hypothetical protein